MPSNDARILRGAAIPTAVAGIIAMVISYAVAGGKGRSAPSSERCW